MKRTLVVMAKAPLPGFAKSRLIDVPGSDEAATVAPELGRFDAERVARLADAFIRDTLSVCERCAHEALTVVFAPPDSEPYFRAVAPGVELRKQHGLDLGARMAAAFAAAFDAGATRVVVIGTDSPHLPPRRLDEAFEALAVADCVLGPASDGGYYLIGLTEARPALFQGIAWGTSTVHAATRIASAAEGLTVASLAQERDIDERRDLAWLAELLRAAPERCPHTSAVLAER